MKYFLLFLGFVLALSGCSPTDPAQEPEHSPPFQVTKSPAARVSEMPSQALILEQAASINNFSVAMYKLLAKGDGNIFFSPYSITAALAMAEAGARGATAEQMRKALSVTLEGDQFHAAINGLDLALTKFAGQTDGVTLNVVNASWAQAGWVLKIGYLDLLSRYYGAGLNLLDFANKPEPSRVIINNWVAGQTNQRIKDLIPKGLITSMTHLVLTNAIYFLGDWLYPFKAELTKDENFTRLDNNVIKTPLMQLGENYKKIKVEYSRTTGVRSVNLPYKGNRLSMVVMLPDEGKFPAFENALSVETINTQITALDSVDVPPLRLPKFEFTSGSLSLKEPLKSLGMKDAFSNADFSGIDGTKELVIADVIHKAFISVDEKGTEAAAATAVIFDKTGHTPDPPQFIADSPFIYLIRDNVTNVILFMGRVLDPTVEQ